jgi:exosortase
MGLKARTAAPIVLTAAALGWAYLPTAGGLAARWSTDPRYSHGYLVPLFAAAWLWSRRASRPVAAASTVAAWLGVGLVASAAGMLLVGTYFFIPWIEAASIVPALAAVSMFAGGLAGLRWAGPAIAFLLFMIPLPYRVESALGGSLQGAAARGSTFLLQTLGLPAFAEGNVITVNAARIGVVEACNGLGMLFTFTALATGFALVVRRSWPETVVIIASAAPIALAANVARITATGVLYETAGVVVADAVYHDLAGWLMMPLALALLAAVLRLLTSSFINEPVAGPERSPGIC